MLHPGSRFFALFSIILANAIYGLNYVVAKGIMPDFLSPRAIIFLRIAGTILISLIFFGLFVKEKISFKDLPRLIFASVFGIALNQIMFFEGLNLTTPIDSAIIMTVSPILVLVFSYFIIKDSISVKKITGIVLGIAGAILMILGKGDISFNSDTFSGNIMILINACSFAMYLVLIKPLTNKYHPLTIMVWTFSLGFLVSLPFTLHPLLESSITTIPLRIWLALGYVIIFSTFLGYLLYNYSLKVLSPTVVSFFIYLQPFFSAIVTMIVYGDKPAAIDYLATSLIFAGVWFVSRKPEKEAEND